MLEQIRDKINKISATTWLIIMVILFFGAVIAVPTIYLHETDFTKVQVVLADDSVTYTGDDIRPDVEVMKGNDELEEGKDYKVVYKDNEDVGKATVKVEGIGIYRGEQTSYFEITKAKQVITGKKTFIKNIETDTFSLKQSAKTKLSYKSSNEKVATVDAKGRITPVGAGKATITVKAAGNDSYGAAEKEVTVKITETEAQKAIRGTLEWAAKIANDDSYTYGNGKCPVCHGTGKHYDCIGFAVAAYWHGGGIDSIHDRCRSHGYIDGCRAYMRDSSEWKNMGKISSSELKPGDMMFFYSKGKSPRNHGWYHVEIYYGDNMTVGAHNKSTGIGIISLSHHLNYAEIYRYVGN